MSNYTIPSGQNGQFLTARSIFMQPGQVSLQSSGQNFYANFQAPQNVGSCTSAYTLYISGSPYGGTYSNGSYALYVASGTTYLQSLILGSGNFSSNGAVSFTGIGNSTNSQASLYILPAITAFSGISNYYFSYFINYLY